LSTPQPLSLLGERLFHLNDQFGLTENTVGSIDQRSASGPIILVAKAGANPSPTLDQNGVTMVYQFRDGGRDKSDAVFVIFDFLRDTNEHHALSNNGYNLA
jgi:hypothetical protein